MTAHMNGLVLVSRPRSAAGAQQTSQTAPASFASTRRASPVSVQSITGAPTP